MTDVSTPTTVQSAMVAKARKVRTLVDGTEAVRRAGEEFLPKEPMESVAAYNVRKQRTVLFNATGKTVDDLVGKVFVKAVIAENDVAPEIVPLLENIDNAGQHINVFAKNAFADAMQPGIGYIFADAPPAPIRADGLKPTLGEYKATGWRPYLTYIPLENLIGWKSATINGVATLTQIRIKECVTVEDPENPFLEKDVDQVRAVTRGETNCTWQTFRKSNDKWSVFEEGTISLLEIPLIPVYLNRTGFMQATPPLLDLANLNIAHLQLDSDVANIMHVANVPILFGSGFEAETAISIGSAEMVRAATRLRPCSTSNIVAKQLAPLVNGLPIWR